ncbi:glycosyltransferase involved in cell wall biosynthesis [Trichococcus patagoniensis]|uniref:Glycosyltransferase involved in cell wall biosynthesis n=1 Tax=Trichococcus patagoniensis TaxID=382641 RepID=A0A2T5IQ29_9LACT|nr:glycosyltransferase family 4 protein [Trichococcus patagoniensis]PTQ85934.1 glycosyltransferase involved in cell wall biosynthesis [Trichococcus patagoniensis]
MENLYKPKVLLVHNFYQVPGGEDTVFKNEKELLEENGHEVITYTRDNEEINNFHLFGKIGYPFNAVFSLKTYHEVKKIILANKIDIVHVHNTWPLISPSVYYAAFHSNVSVVQTVHNFRLICPGGTLYHNGKICEDSLYKGLRSSIKNKIYKGSLIHTLISAATLKIHRVIGTYKKVNYIFLTEFNKKKVLELNNKERIIIDESKTFIKPNYVSMDREIIPFDERKNQFVFVGRLDKLKGIDLLLEVWGRIKETDLIICGTGPEEEWCRKYIEENRMSNVYLMGYIKNEKAREIISESKALILPTQLYEGFPMTIVESFACGTPVIGSDIGNTGNLIKEGLTGKKFQFDSADSLREVVNRIHDMTDSCRLEYESKYTSDINYKELLSIYDFMLDGK